jgi:hypothetical protein
MRSHLVDIFRLRLTRFHLFEVHIFVFRRKATAGVEKICKRLSRVWGGECQKYFAMTSFAEFSMVDYVNNNDFQFDKKEN